MNRIALTLAAVVLSTSAASAFADGGIGLSGSYGDLPHATATRTGTLTRAQVRADLAQAQRDGSLATLRKTISYPQGVDLAQRPAQSESGSPASELASASR